MNNKNKLVTIFLISILFLCFYILLTLLIFNSNSNFIIEYIKSSKEIKKVISDIISKKLIINSEVNEKLKNIFPYGGSTPEFVLKTLSVEKFPNEKKPILTDSKITLHVKKVKNKPVLDGKKDDIYPEFKSIKTDFYNNLLMSACYDEDNFYLFIKFHNNKSYKTIYPIFYIINKNKIIKMDYYESYLFDPAYIFFDIYIEDPDYPFENIYKDKEAKFDWWHWNPVISFTNFCEDKNVIISRKTNRKIIKKYDPCVIFLNETYPVLAYIMYESGNPFYKEKKIEDIFILNKHIVNAYSYQIPTKSQKDVKVDWWFNSTIKNFEKIQEVDSIGKWEIEIVRKLITNYPDDVQFDLKKHKKYRIFIPYIVIPYSKDPNIHSEVMKKYNGKTLPYITLEFE